METIKIEDIEKVISNEPLFTDIFSEEDINKIFYFQDKKLNFKKDLFLDKIKDFDFVICYDEDWREPSRHIKIWIDIFAKNKDKHNVYSYNYINNPNNYIDDYYEEICEEYYWVINNFYPNFINKN